MGRYFGTSSNNIFKAYREFLGWRPWTIYGNGGNDRLTGGLKNDRMYGGTGRDYLNGSSGNDYIRGGSNNDSVYGSYGNDSLYGDSGNDYLSGGSGNDTLSGGTGSDRMYGGTGNDKYYVNSSLDKVYEYSRGGRDTVNSTISYRLGTHVENLTLSGSAYRGYGNSAGNTIKGNKYNNYLSGYAGNDYLYGNGGRDTLSGGSSNDYLNGGSGNDYLLGGSGSDRLRGGSGSDTINAYGGTTREYDSLSGDHYTSRPGSYSFGDGADKFILGDSRRVFYRGNGYATITDFNRREGDKIQLHGRRSDYSLGTSTSYKGTSALDTVIRYKGDTIGIVQDTTAVSLYSDVQIV